MHLKGAIVSGCQGLSGLGRWFDRGDGRLGWSPCHHQEALGGITLQTLVDFRLRGQRRARLPGSAGLKHRPALNRLFFPFRQDPDKAAIPDNGQQAGDCPGRRLIKR